MSDKVAFERLMEPSSIGRTKTRNRIIKTASGAFYLEPTGHVGERSCAYYETIAKGGVGLLIVESCGVEYPLGVQHSIQIRELLLHLRKANCLGRILMHPEG
jgi:2,4-dienoyl-CoA reductase-like NADH-dependent reductase (Old Yellow Enzyme family)